MKRYTARQVHRTLAKYELQTLRLVLAPGLELEIVEVKDTYALLDRQNAYPRGERFPYWAEVWPASVALARWLFQAGVPRPSTATVELGCGVGLVGIALAHLGWEVEATDFVEDALILASHNARLNRVAGRHRVAYLDWACPVGRPCSCMVASDVVYEKKNHSYLVSVLDHLLLPGGRFYLSDPQRPPAKRFVELLRQQGYGHCAETHLQPWNGLTHKIDIHVFCKPR